MFYLPIGQNDLSDAVKMYNASIASGELLYKPLSEEEFYDLFLKPVKSIDKVFSYYSPGKEGFVIGHFDGGIRRYFLTMIVVKPSCRRKGIGKGLIDILEKTMEEDAAANGLPAPQMEVSYFNPVNITWILPETDGHVHPNSPGVRLGSPAHLFLKNLEFVDFSHQNSYDLPLKTYVWHQEKLQKYVDRFEKAGYRVEFYDPKKHYGMQDLVDDLNNDLWNWQIPGEMNREGGPRPMLIVNDHGRVGGFAGPIVVEPTGRGWLLGLAVHSQCRGVGAATMLFNRMCEAFRDAGASYMTFFTAEDNIARRIYEGAGAKIKASWADMKRRDQTNR